MGYFSFLTGEVVLMATPRVMEDFLICDGSQVSRTLYSDLFETLLYTYDGSGNDFGLPNLPAPPNMSYQIRARHGMSGPNVTFTATDGVLGDVRYLAGPVQTFFDCPVADGRSLPIQAHQATFSILGYRFGGSGNNFNIPNVPKLGTGAGVTPYLLVAGVYPQQGPGSAYAETLLAQIRLATPTYVEVGFVACDGATYPLSDNTALYSLLGNNFGGSGNTYGVPTLPQIAGVDQRLCSQGFYPSFD